MINISDLGLFYEKGKPGIRIPVKCNENDFEELKNLCWEKANEIYDDEICDLGKERLEKELEFIHENNFASFYFTAYKFISWCKERNHLNLSKGLIGASLVNHVLGICKVDPLNPETESSIDFVLGTDGKQIPSYEFAVTNTAIKELQNFAHEIESRDSKTYQEERNYEILIMANNLLDKLEYLEKYTGVKEEDIDWDEIDIFNFFMQDSFRGVDMGDPDLLQKLITDNPPVDELDVREIYAKLHSKGIRQKPEDKYYYWPLPHCEEYTRYILALIWYKIYFPVQFYAVVLTDMVDMNEDFDFEILAEGRGRIELEYYKESFRNQNKPLVESEKSYKIKFLELVIECLNCGIEFLPGDLEKSDLVKFLQEESNIRLPLYISNGPVKPFKHVGKLMDEFMFERFGTENDFDNLSEIVLPSFDFEEYRKIIPEYMPGVLYEVEGRHSVGKTAFILNEALYVTTKLGKPAYIFANDKTQEELLERLILQITDIDFKTIEGKDMSDDVKEKLLQCQAFLKHLPIFICDSLLYEDDIAFSNINDGVIFIRTLNLIDIGICKYYENSKETRNGGDAKRILNIRENLSIIAGEMQIPIVVCSKADIRNDYIGYEYGEYSAYRNMLHDGMIMDIINIMIKRAWDESPDNSEDEIKLLIQRKTRKEDDYHTEKLIRTKLDWKRGKLINN